MLTGNREEDYATCMKLAAYEWNYAKLMASQADMQAAVGDAIRRARRYETLAIGFASA